MSPHIQVQLIILLLDTISYILYLLVMCRKARRRDGFGWRLPVLILLQAVLCLPLALLRAGQDTLWMRILIEVLFSAVQLLALPFLYRGSSMQYLMWFSGILMTKNFSGNAYQFLMNLSGILDWLIYFSAHILLLF